MAFWRFCFFTRVLFCPLFGAGSGIPFWVLYKVVKTRSRWFALLNNFLTLSPALSLSFFFIPLSMTFAVLASLARARSLSFLFPKQCLPSMRFPHFFLSIIPHVSVFTRLSASPASETAKAEGKGKGKKGKRASSGGAPGEDMGCKTRGVPD